MDNTLTKGQIVRFKGYKRRPDEKEAYFVVIQEATPTQEMVLYTLNTNRLFHTGATVIPDYPDEDLEIRLLKPQSLFEEEVTLIKGRTKSELTGVIFDCTSDEEYLTFALVNGFLESNAKFDYHTSKNQLLRGKLYVALHY